MITTWFLCPYKGAMAPRPIPGSRYCAMDDFTSDIVAAGGEWSEAEIDGDQAIVRVRAPSALLASIGIVYRRLSETGARALWTPTRSKPGWDAVDQRIIFQPTKQQACKTLDHIMLEVPETRPSVELSALIAAWSAVGFGMGWRLPHEIVMYLASKGLPPLDSTGLPYFFGSFPTTGILDNFNRANEGPPPSANWTGPVQTGEEGLRVTSNECDQPAGGTAGSGVWVGTFGPGSECFSTIAAVPTTNGNGQAHFVRVVDPNTAGVDGYLPAYINLGGGIYRDYYTYRLDNNAYTQLGVTVTGTTLGVGDDIGGAIIGSTLRTYRRVGVGLWTEEDSTSRTDSTYTAAGRIGMRLDNTCIADDFGGGTVTLFPYQPWYHRAPVIAQ